MAGGKVMKNTDKLTVAKGARWFAIGFIGAALITSPPVRISFADCPEPEPAPAALMDVPDCAPGHMPLLGQYPDGTARIVCTYVPMAEDSDND
jgi:hypothetical protein